MNHFEAMEIDPIVLSLDTKVLEARFHELSKRHHPDRIGNSLEILEKSAAINGAYRCLRDPWSRATYILKLFQIQLGSKVPPCLAPVYFELQEAADKSALLELRETLLKGKKLRDHQLNETFKAFDDLGLRSVVVPAQGTALTILTLIQELVLEHNYAQSMLRDLEKKIG